MKRLVVSGECMDWTSEAILFRCILRAQLGSQRHEIRVGELRTVVFDTAVLTLSSLGASRGITFGLHVTGESEANRVHRIFNGCVNAFRTLRFNGFCGD